MATRSPKPKALPRSTKSKALKPAALPKKKAGGRPSAYSPAFDELAENLTLLGLTLEELGKAMGVATSTISLWFKTHASFSDAITRARLIADAKVARSLYDQAIGYEFMGAELKPGKNPGEFDLYSVPQYVPKNVNATRFWLMNRQPGRWKSTPEEHDDGKNSGPVGKVTVTVQASPFKKPEKPAEITAPETTAAVKAPDA